MPKTKERSRVHECLICGQPFKPSVGHCVGGRWKGCCRSFVSNSGGDAHKIGAFDDGSNRCMTDEELLERGWVKDDQGYWNSPRDIKKREELRARVAAGQGPRARAAGHAASGTGAPGEPARPTVPPSPSDAPTAQTAHPDD